MGEEQAFQTGYVVGLLVSMAAFFAIACLVWAVFLRLATQWVQGMQISFARAFGTAVLAALAGGAPSFVIGLLAPLLVALEVGPTVINAMHVVSLLAGFFIAAAVVSWMLGVRYSQSVLITVVVYALHIGVVTALAALFIGIPEVFSG